MKLEEMIINAKELGINQVIMERSFENEVRELQPILSLSKRVIFDEFLL